MKKRLKKIFRIAALVFLWIIIFCLAALPAVFMNSIYGYLPVLLLFFAVIISLLCLILQRRSVSIDSGLEDLQCVRGQSVNVGLKLKNKSIIACPHVSARLFISDLFGGNDSVRIIPVCLDGKSTVDLGFGMDMTHIGLYSVGLEYIELRDFFGIFRCKIPDSGSFTAFVTPRIRPVEEFIVSDEALTESDRDTRVTVVGGMDYTGVREYTPGDPMKQIHWKLSAHARSYMTRLQESNRQQEYAVILDFAADENKDREQLMDLNDCLIETALSLITEISRHDAAYALLYTDRNGTIARSVPRGRDNDMELLRSFSGISPDPPPEYPDAVRILSQESRRQNRSTNVVIVTSRITPELPEMLLTIKRQKRSPELYYVYPSALSSRELEHASAPLQQLNSAEIPWFLVSTAENLQSEVPGEGSDG